MPDQRGVARPIGPKCDIGAVEGDLVPSYFFHNLIFNGDAEASAGSPSGAFVGAPNWIPKVGQLTVVPYNAPGGFPSVPTDTVPINHGANFFAGGDAPTSTAYTLVALAPFTASLRANSVNYASRPTWAVS